jgi:hypothetical protein
MASTLPLWLGTEPSNWSTGFAVGIGVALMGALLFLLSGGLRPPGSGIAYGAYLLSLFLISLGVATVLGSLVVRRRRGPAQLPEV